jgi:hypothetical protein
LRSDQPEQVWLLAEVTKDVVHIESIAVGTVPLSRDFAQSKIALGMCVGANRAAVESIPVEFPYFSRKRELLN